MLHQTFQQEFPLLRSGRQHCDIKLVTNVMGLVLVGDKGGLNQKTRNLWVSQPWQFTSLDPHMAYQATVLLWPIGYIHHQGQYGHVIILWTIYGHLCFGAFMALHLNPEPIAAIYAQM
ncbi:hypothetical protein O181_094016, partial [Austropuccinia psidii MF-1]|nr:hypothetical protein [Austropuccinia psidii MF-1]